MAELMMNVSNHAAQAPVLQARICTVFELLNEPTLTIPRYQRPYKWSTKHIQQLLDDISTHRDKSAYRLGTIVFHLEGDTKQIVDGQQRTISLLLTARALIQRSCEKPLERKALQDQLEALTTGMVNPVFGSEISQRNIRNNYLEVARIVARSDFTEAHIDFLLNKCQVVTVALNNVSEAFQFFDSQNARGRDLEPHDLLKAYHLREFSVLDESRKVSTVNHWENCDADELATLFSEYLYRIRSWSKGLSARYFTKEDTDLFKGVNLDTIDGYPMCSPCAWPTTLWMTTTPSSPARSTPSGWTFPFT